VYSISILRNSRALEAGKKPARKYAVRIASASLTTSVRRSSNRPDAKKNENPRISAISPKIASLP